MSTTSHPSWIAILPVGAARRAELARILEGGGLIEPPGRAGAAQLAIVDVTEAGGFEALRSVVKEGIPTIAVVNRSDASLAAQAQQIGATDFIDLSALSSELMLRVRRAIAHQATAKKAEESKDFLERLINSSVDAIIAADMRGRVILFNKGAENISGYRADEALGKLNVTSLYPPGVAQQIMAQLRDPRSSRGRLAPCRQEIIAKNGERLPVNMTASIIYEGQRETATVGIFTDLRDRMRLERKLSDFENRLEESEKTSVIVELAGTAAHELNQPLTSVMGYADLLKRKLKQDDFAYHPVEIIYREAERMAEIVRKIGKITRYETKSYIGTAKILDLDKASSHEE